MEADKPLATPRMALSLFPSARSSPFRGGKFFMGAFKKIIIDNPII